MSEEFTDEEYTIDKLDSTSAKKRLKQSRKVTQDNLSSDRVNVSESFQYH